jgi:hypothetical protein
MLINTRLYPASGLISPLRDNELAIDLQLYVFVPTVTKNNELSNKSTRSCSIAVFWLSKSVSLSSNPVSPNSYVIDQVVLSIFFTPAGVSSKLSAAGVYSIKLVLLIY